MNKPELIQLIQQPELPSAKHAAALRQVLNDFPYFTNAQVILSQALKNEGHYEYEKYLKQTALAVPDREVLYYYLHQLAPYWENKVSPITAEVTLIEEAVTVPTHEAVQETSLHQEIIPEPVQEVGLNNETSTPTSLINSQESDELPETTYTTDPETLLSADELEIENTINVLLENPSVTPSQIPKEPIEAEATASVIEHQVEEEKGTDKEEAHSFMEWLQLASGKAIVNHTKESPQLAVQENKEELVVETPQIPLVNVPAAETKEPEIVAEKTTLPSVSEITKAEIAEAVNKSNVNDFHNILDKFIKENPSISRPKAEFFNPVNMAKQSVEEDEELVTETLASLYYRQGNYKKAIRAYEKLCLIYPSKMTYFASLIQKIKNEIKD